MISSATPAACGLDMDVPAIAWYSWPDGPLSVLEGRGVMPAMIWIPGAAISGLMNSPSGPRDENDAMTSPCAADAVPACHVAMTCV